MSQATSPDVATLLFEPRPGEITQAPTARQVSIDRAFRALCTASGFFTLVLVAYIVGRIAVSAVPAMQHYGLGFLTSRVWDPNTERYGILGEMWGTLYTSILALIIGTALGVAAAVFLSEGFLGFAAFAVLKALRLQLHPIANRLPNQL